MNNKIRDSHARFYTSITQFDTCGCFSTFSFVNHPSIDTHMQNTLVDTEHRVTQVDNNMLLP